MSVAHRENLKICLNCGEIYDANIESEALHHAVAGHQPLLPPRKGWAKTPRRELARAA